MAVLESKFQGDLIRELRKTYPGCYILKNDPNYLQGVPDLIILYQNKWAMLECKRSRPAPKDYQPNQEWYIDDLDKMSFASAIYPENKKDVLRDLQQVFSSRG